MRSILSAIALCLLIASAFADTTGTFSNPNPTCPPATCSGVGTNVFTWGIPFTTPGSLTFNGNPNPTNPSGPYQLGTLVYHNGTIASGSEVNQVTLNTNTNFTDLTNSLLNVTFNIVNTPNGGFDPNADADYIFVSGFQQSFHVFEDASSSIELWAQDGRFIGFKNPGEGGFVPEPATLMLFGTGIAGLLARVRKNRP